MRPTIREPGWMVHVRVIGRDLLSVARTRLGPLATRVRSGAVAAWDRSAYARRVARAAMTPFPVRPRWVWETGILAWGALMAGLLVREHPDWSVGYVVLRVVIPWVVGILIGAGATVVLQAMTAHLRFFREAQEAEAAAEQARLQRIREMYGDHWN